MKFIRLKTNDPYYNLAVEEYLLKNSDEDIFMLWQNEPCVVIGKNQNAYAEVDLEYAKEQGIKIVRRITGGGAVYHDLGNVNYTFITSSEKARSLDYEYFTRPIIDALAHFGVDCKLSGRNDLECDGKKISGNAQHTENGRILHHGTLLFDADVDTMSKVLRANKEKLEFNAVKSHSSRVTNIKKLLSNDISLNSFIDSIEKFVTEHYSAEKWVVDVNETINALKERNLNDEWIYSNKRYLTNYRVRRHKKYSFGIVDIELMLSKNIIEDIVISGDFFGVEPIEKLERELKGQNINSVNVTNVCFYIDKMTDDEFLELIKG